MNLEEALQKVYANPGLLTKSSSIAPGAFAKPVEELNPKPKRRSTTPPTGTSNAAIAAARVREVWPTIGQHLGAAMRANPGSKEIGDAGQTWASFDQVGLGIDSRFLEGGFSVGVTPNNEALAEAWAHSTGDKMAAAQIQFRKSLTITRQAPNVITRNGGQISSRAVFSKSADDSEVAGESEAGQLLRRHSLDTALAHMQILQDKISTAMKEVGSDAPAYPHLSAAYQASGNAKSHLEGCLENEDD